MIESGYKLEVPLIINEICVALNCYPQLVEIASGIVEFCIFHCLFDFIRRQQCIESLNELKMIVGGLM